MSSADFMELSLQFENGLWGVLPRTKITYNTGGTYTLGASDTDASPMVRMV
jgi:hypothetical protein